MNKNLPNIQIGERDIAILDFVGELGIVDRRMVHARFWPHTVSARAAQQRLSLFADHSLIRTIKLDGVSYGDKKGGRPAYLFALAERGAEVVERATGHRPPRILQKELKAMTICHRRDVSFFRLAWEDACHQNALQVPTCVMDYDIRTGLPPNTPPMARRTLYHTFTIDDRRVSYCPDLCSLTIIPNPKQPNQPTHLVAISEIDRNTEGSKQLLNKLPGLAELVRTKDFRHYIPSLLPQHVVRVLWVSIDAGRTKELRRIFQGQPIAKLFRFASMPDMVPAKILTKPVWTDIEGNPRTILLTS